MRKRLLGEGNFRKYTLYALSEIFLVVIGILIALGLNNWNQTRKEHEEEIALLKGINQQLQEDHQNLKNSIERTEERRKRVLSILDLLEDPESINIRDFALLQLDLTEDDYFVSQRAIFDEAVSSGKLNLIRNDELRQRIFQYYSVISNERDNDRLQYKITNELIAPIMVEEVASTKEYMDIFSKSRGYNINTNIPSLDLEELAKSKKYYQAIIYAMRDEFQVRDWRQYSTLASNLMRSVRFELRDYGIEVERENEEE